MTPTYSKTQIDKAGARLREVWTNRRKITLEDRDAIELIWSYRAAFNYPLTKVNANLRYYVKPTGPEVIIAQRMKRLPRIIEKLARHPRMRMSQMQDVGGCRAVLSSQDAVAEVLEGMERNWDLITVDDYVNNPRSTGYRAVHAIVRKDDVPIEVQLRTVGQQDWADEVERIDGLIPEALKDGEAPADILEYTMLLAEVIAKIDAGQKVDRAEIQALVNLQGRVP